MSEQPVKREPDDADSDAPAGSRGGVSVIVAVRNGETVLGDQLEALRIAKRPPGGFEVIVADNGSTDRTVAVARSFEGRLQIRVIDASDRLGVSHARNVGVAAARFDHLLFCDADDRVDGDWLVAMRRAFDQGHELIAGPIDYRELNDPVVRAWRGGDRAGVPVAMGFLPTGHGANLGVRGTVHHRIGGFDESFAWGCEDIDYCWRAQLSGSHFHELPEAVVHYRLRSTLRELARQESAYGVAEPQLYAKFANEGMQRRSVGDLAQDLLWLVSRLPLTWDSRRRGAWVRRAARHVGRLRGAWSHKVWWW